MRRSLLPFAVLVLVGGCLHDHALDYDELHVSATRGDAGPPVSTQPIDGCVTLPLLVGSRVDETIVVGSEIHVEVSATRDRVKVQFAGTENAPSRTIDARDLRAGYTDDIEVTSFADNVFTVRLRSGCPESDAPN